MYDLSFTEEFFTGTGYRDIYDIQPSDRPTSVYQAIISLPKRTMLDIARYLGAAHPVLYIQSEDFPFDVLERIRETDLCDDLTPPIRVYIDPDQWFYVDIYDDRDDD